MIGTHRYETPLVILSILIAIGASYTALSLAGRVAASRGRARAIWLLGGSIAMGTGIWSMHFVAMLAFHLMVPISYDVPLVALSYLAAVAASAFALFVAGQTSLSKPRLLAAGCLLGVAIVTMHYTGMAAVRVPAHLGYDPLLVAASVVIAVTAATVALWLFLWLRNDNTRRGRSLRAAAAVVMGLAIAGMHYTGMAAAQFTHVVAFTPDPRWLASAGLAVPVAIATAIILALTLIGSITDHWVRVRLAAAEALRASEERYRSVVSEIDEVIFRTDADGRWTFLNRAWTEITGYAPEESLGKPLLDSVHPDDRALVDGAADYSRKEVRYLTRDHGARWVEVHARATRDGNGQLVGTAGVIRDVTERRRAEEELTRAREVAEAASRAKSEFLSRMSHELRTPLNAILGFGQLMELETSTPFQQENVDHILGAGRHLLALINEVLDITGIESGRLVLSNESVDVRDVVQETLALMTPLAAARRVTLSAGAPTSNSHVRADRQRLKQVLLNLAANAVKYNREGGRAQIAWRDAGDGLLRIAVTDTGPGISADSLKRLFTPFDRLGAEQTGIEGTGLGLALSKRLVEAMGGEIGVETVLGVGSTFWVELPVSQPVRVDSAEYPVHNGSEAHTSTDAKRRARTVLYVEDNLSNLTLVQRILARRPDIELIPSMQGGLALELARSHHPDLVLLDLHLPDMPGEEVLRQLRQASDCRGIPVVVVSADATPGQIDRLLGAGALAFVTKPLDVKPFIKIVDDLLDAKGAA